MTHNFPLISKYSTPLSDRLGIVLSAPITNGITVTFTLHIFRCRAWSWYLSIFFLFFYDIICSAWTIKSIIGAENLRELYLKAARRSERKTLSWQQGDDRADQFRSIQIPQFLMLWWPVMKAGVTAMTQRPRDRFPGGSMLALPHPRRPDRANPPTNVWWSLFLTALAWSTCTGFPLDRQSTRNTMLRF